MNKLKSYFKEITSDQRNIIEVKGDSAQITIEHYPFAYQINEKIAEDIKKCGDKQNYTTNAQAYMTDWHFSTPEVEIIKSWIYSILRNRLLPGFIDRTTIFDVWGVVYRKGDYTFIHDHVPACFSFVYYVKCDKNSSPLIFTASGLKIYPEPGKLVIFPSHLMHFVPKQKGNGERIVLSGNIHVNGHF